MTAVGAAGFVTAAAIAVDEAEVPLEFVAVNEIV